MSQEHPFFSRLGCLGALVLVIGIAVAVFLTGGEIFSPGPLTALSASGQALGGYPAHAEFESDCARCHAPWRGVTAERCEQCHTDVAQERAAGSGLHGHLAPAEAARCGRCHPDHQGADYSPAQAALAFFDHRSAGFRLDRHTLDFTGAPVTCDRCHSGAGYIVAAASCADCHAGADPDFMARHWAAFGNGCVQCHDGAPEPPFDHASTKFLLEGKHAAAACTDCHQGGAPVSPDCASCHEEPAAHAGVFETSCADCHNADAWSPADVVGLRFFAHAATPFKLGRHGVDFSSAPITCRGCHAGPDLSFRTLYCADCHAQDDPAFLAEHQAEYGPYCADCHDGAGNMKGFDHARIFALDGKHAPLACADCHKDLRFQRGAGRSCADCHAEPTVHAGLFGKDCAACHTSEGWTPARLTRHTFPLTHGNEADLARPAEQTCAVCHPDTYTNYTCYGCHDHDPAAMRQEHDEEDLAGRALEECAACHPGGQKEGDD
jgi:hypothetical protein